MNANLKDLKAYYKNRSLNGIIISDEGKPLSDKAARVYIDYCIEKGYVDLYSCPDFDDVKHELKY